MCDYPELLTTLRGLLTTLRGLLTTLRGLLTTLQGCAVRVSYRHAPSALLYIPCSHTSPLSFLPMSSHASFSSAPAVRGSSFARRSRPLLRSSVVAAALSPREALTFIHSRVRSVVRSFVPLSSSSPRRSLRARSVCLSVGLHSFVRCRRRDTPSLPDANEAARIGPADARAAHTPRA